MYLLLILLLLFNTVFKLFYYLLITNYFILFSKELELIFSFGCIKLFISDMLRRLISFLSTSISNYSYARVIF